MRKVHLIREFAPDAYDFALSSWSWIGTGDKTPRFASCFGDMFLESLDGWWFLDTVEGTLERRWNTMDAMFADLEGSDGRAEYLLEETLNAALQQGLRLGDDEVFAFLPPPAVTGTMSVDSLAPLRFAIAANLAGRIHGELNGVQPDAGASALFAAQKYAAQQAAAQEFAAQEAAQKYAAQSVAAQHFATAPAFDAPNPQTDRWEPAAQQVNTGAYPAYRPAQEPEYAGAQYAAGSELDYGSSRAQGYDSGAYTTAPAASAAPVGAHAAAPAAAPVPAQGGQGYAGQGWAGGPTAYDYLDNSHTADSGQFSQYIADQYNTGQVAAVDYGASAPVQPRPLQGGRRSYAG
ncbi:hypothetical protein ACFT2C_11885 [Promicromonospora sp. NPDC057138]|uniref:hypothetical protein n=1 Tax=Promicromonospora sp. NPDC057138 TaxID=3346031 RepID=UPI00363146B8